ncbi:MAG: hypothetical protein ACAI34_12880 [Verrucomicrobium sp.]|nr:hypothetical protein [Verrucomicrobium sp.]
MNSLNREQIEVLRQQYLAQRSSCLEGLALLNQMAAATPLAPQAEANCRRLENKIQEYEAALAAIKHKSHGEHVTAGKMPSFATLMLSPLLALCFQYDLSETEKVSPPTRQNRTTITAQA